MMHCCNGRQRERDTDVLWCLLNWQRAFLRRTCVIIYSHRYLSILLSQARSSKLSISSFPLIINNNNSQPSTIRAMEREIIARCIVWPVIVSLCGRAFRYRYLLPDWLCRHIYLSTLYPTIVHRVSSPLLTANQCSTMNVNLKLWLHVVLPLLCYIWYKGKAHADRNINIALCWIGGCIDQW